MKLFYAGRIDFKDKGTDKLFRMCKGHDLTVVDWGADRDKAPSWVKKVPFLSESELKRRILEADVVMGQFVYGGLGTIDRMVLRLDKPLCTHIDSQLFKRYHGSVPPHMESLSDPLPRGIKTWMDKQFDPKKIKRIWHSVLGNPKEWAFVGDLCGVQSATAKLLGCEFGWWSTFFKHNKVVVCGTFPKWARFFGKQYVFYALGADLREHPEEAKLAKTITCDPQLALEHNVVYIPAVL
jgi:hypothetical protein